MSKNGRPGKMSTINFSDLVQGDDMTTFKVGEDQVEFKVHKKLASHFSGYLEKALNGKFEESTTGLFTLHDTSVETFKYFAQWVYAFANPDSLSEVLAEIGSAIDLHIFADRYDVPKLRHATLIRLFDLLSNGRRPSYEHILHACANLPDNSKVLLLLAHAHAISPEDLNSERPVKVTIPFSDNFMKFHMMVMKRSLEMREQTRGRRGSRSLWYMGKLQLYIDSTESAEPGKTGSTPSRKRARVD